MSLLHLDRDTRDALFEKIASNVDNSTKANLTMALPSQFSETEKFPSLVGMTQMRIHLCQGHIDSLAGHFEDVKRAMDACVCSMGADVVVRTDIRMTDRPVTIGGKEILIAVDSTGSNRARDIHTVKLKTKIGKSKKHRNLNFRRNKDGFWHFDTRCRNANLLTALVVVVRALKKSGCGLRGKLAVPYFSDWELVHPSKQRDIVARGQLKRLLFD